MSKSSKINISAYAAAAIAINFALFLIKLYAGLTSSSICIYSDAINNMFDTLACALALTGSIIMKKGANDSYPNGHSRTEQLIGFVMSCIISVTGAYFAYCALERFLYPRPVNFLVKHAALLAGTIAVKLIMGFIYKKAADKTGSVILKTIYIDSFSDTAVTAMSLLTFAFSNNSGLRVDATFGLIISIIIIVNAVRLVKSSSAALLGKTDPEICAGLREILAQNNLEADKINVFTETEPPTAAIVISGDGDENNAKKQAEDQLKIQIFINRRQNNG